MDNKDINKDLDIKKDKKSIVFKIIKVVLILALYVAAILLCFKSCKNVKALQLDSAYEQLSYNESGYYGFSMSLNSLKNGVSSNSYNFFNGNLTHNARIDLNNGSVISDNGFYLSDPIAIPDWAPEIFDFYTYTNVAGGASEPDIVVVFYDLNGNMTEFYNSYNGYSYNIDRGNTNDYWAFRFYFEYNDQYIDWFKDKISVGLTSNYYVPYGFNLYHIGSMYDLDIYSYTTANQLYVELYDYDDHSSHLILSTSRTDPLSYFVYVFYYNHTFYISLVSVSGDNVTYLDVYSFELYQSQTAYIVPFHIENGWDDFLQYRGINGEFTLPYCAVGYARQIPEGMSLNDFKTHIVNGYVGTDGYFYVDNSYHHEYLFGDVVSSFLNIRLGSIEVAGSTYSLTLGFLLLFILGLGALFIILKVMLGG